MPLLEVDLTAPGSLARLAGLDVDFLGYRPGYRARVLGWPGTLETIRAAGLPVTVISRDAGGDLARSRGLRPRAPAAFLAPSAGWNVPPMGRGSLAGFWTAAEVGALLDSLAATDSQGIVGTLDTLGTSVQGRPILALAVTDGSRPLGTRPEVLLTALHHAREPEGMQVVLYFLQRLLSGYGIDPVLTYLVREREIWFVPVVNPDGYVRNQNTWDNAGAYGLWRKNLRNNDGNPNITGNDGVDLNRNYGYQWGYDNEGSSGSLSSPVYRGPGPFSEPETQVLRDFCNAHTFRIADNYHAFWETSLYPWGYIDAETPDGAAFTRLGDALTERNHYSYGHGTQILYPVNGEANDWMYGDTTTKPKIFAYTTEVGTQIDGFWPPPSRILPLAELNYAANVALAYAAGVYLRADSLTVESPGGVIRPGEVRYAAHQLRDLGVHGSTTGGVTVRMTSGDPGFSVEQDVVRFPDLGPGQATRPQSGSRFLLRAAAGLPNGTRVPLYLEITDGGPYYGVDTLAIRVGEPDTLFADDGASGLAHWSATGTWGTETVDGDPAFSDSPAADYAPGTDASLELDPSLDLSGALHAVLRFRARWDIETGYDFARVEASTDSGTTWTALPGTGTRAGHGYGAQPTGTPGYDGNQRFWSEEEVDLSPFAGTGDLRLRFRLTSDANTEQDGWLVDDVVVAVYPELAPVSVAHTTPPLRPRLTVAPNPFGTRARIYYALDVASPVRIAVYDVSGREVRLLADGYAQPGERTLVWDGTGAAGRPVAAGTYFVRLRYASGVESAKLLLVR